MKNKWRMTANPDSCRTCNMCQLVCSLKQDSTFNPSKAFIKISNVIKSSGKLDVAIAFTDECDSCGLCAQYCAYSALAREKLEAI